MVAPVRVKEKDIHLFVHSQQDWVIKAVNKFASKQRNIKKLAPETYAHGVLIPYRGKKVKLIVQPTSKNKLQIEFKHDEFIAHVPVHFCKHETSEMIRLALVDWMKADALQKVEVIVEQYARLHKLTPRFIKIKTQKSRWGSCGIHNDINLNWLLVLASPEIMEYVVVHELCHIKERNHSIRFWQLVEAHLPNYQQARKWLKLNGRYLMQGL